MKKTFLMVAFVLFLPAFLFVRHLVVSAASPAGSISMDTPTCATTGLCSAQLSWNTTDIASTKVSVVVDPGLNGSSNDFSFDLSCASASCGSVDWMQPGHSYTFDLYNLDTGALIDTTSVTIPLPATPTPVVPTSTPVVTPPACTATCCSDLACGTGKKCINPGTIMASCMAATTVPLNAQGQLNPGWISEGGGRYYNGLLYSNADGSIQSTQSDIWGAAYKAANAIKVPALVADAASGCTGFETTVSCHPEWKAAQAQCVTGTYNEQGHSCTVPWNSGYTSSQICGPNYMDGPCRPARVNPYAAAAIARQAEEMGKKLGYTISCAASMATLPFGVDPNTGLSYFMNSLCTINGQEGYGAELLVTNTNNWAVVAEELKGNNISSSTIGTSGSTTPPTVGKPATTSSGTPIPSVSSDIRKQIQNANAASTQQRANELTRMLQGEYSAATTNSGSALTGEALLQSIREQIVVLLAKVKELQDKVAALTAAGLAH